MPSVQITPEETIDPAMLFQWFVVVSKNGELLMQKVMNYKPSPFPPPILRPETFSEKQISHKKLSK